MHKSKQKKKPRSTGKSSGKTKDVLLSSITSSKGDEKKEMDYDDLLSRCPIGFPMKKFWFASRDKLTLELFETVKMLPHDERSLLKVEVANHVDERFYSLAHVDEKSGTQNNIVKEASVILHREIKEMITYGLFCWKLSVTTDNPKLQPLPCRTLLQKMNVPPELNSLLQDDIPEVSRGYGLLYSVVGVITCLENILTSCCQCPPMRERVHLVCRADEQLLLSKFRDYMMGYEVFPQQQASSWHDCLAPALVTSDSEFYRFLPSLLIYIHGLASLLNWELATYAFMKDPSQEIHEIKVVTQLLMLQHLCDLFTQRTDADTAKTIIHRYLNADNLKNRRASYAEAYSFLDVNMATIDKWGMYSKRQNFGRLDLESEDNLPTLVYAMCLCRKEPAADDEAVKPELSTPQTCNSCLECDHRYSEILLERLDATLVAQQKYMTFVERLLEHLGKLSTGLDELSRIVVQMHHAIGFGHHRGFSFNCHRVLLSTIKSLERMAQQSPTFKVLPECKKCMARDKCRAILNLSLSPTTFTDDYRTLLSGQKKKKNLMASFRRLLTRHFKNDCDSLERWRGFMAAQLKATEAKIDRCHQAALQRQKQQDPRSSVAEVLSVLSSDVVLHSQDFLHRCAPRGDPWSTHSAALPTIQEFYRCSNVT